MRGLLTLLLALPVLISGIAIAPSSPARADDLADRIAASKARQQGLLDQIARQHDLLAQLKDDEGLADAALTSSRSRLDEINVDQAALHEEMAAATDALHRVEARRDSLVADLRRLDWTLQILQTEIAQGEEDLAASKRLLGQRIADAYRTGQTTLLQQLLETGSFTDVLTGVGSTLAFGDQDAELAASIQTGQASLDSLRRLTAATRYNTDQLRLQTLAAERDLADQKADLAAAQARLTALEDETRSLQQDQRDEWDRINTDQDAAAASIAADAAAGAALESQISGLVAEAQRRAEEAQRRAEEARRRAEARQRRQEERDHSTGGGNGGNGGNSGNSGNSSNGPLSWPVSGYVTQEYGCTGFSWEPPRGSCEHFHSGIDISNGDGTLIRAAADGVIAFVGYNPYENPDPAFIVVIGHAGGITTQYVHLQPRYAPGIDAGAYVSRGQVIGYMGNTGHSTGTHLHWEVHQHGRLVNPRALL